LKQKQGFIQHGSGLG